MRAMVSKRAVLGSSRMAVSGATQASFYQHDQSRVKTEPYSTCFNRQGAGHIVSFSKDGSLRLNVNQ